MAITKGKGKGKMVDMKKFFIAVISLTIASQASADMLVALHKTLGSTPGGELTVTLSSASDPIGIYSYPDNKTFGTFCIETDETVIADGRPYWVELNTYAVQGGLNTNSNDDLDPRSAWIYTQWVNNEIEHTSTNADIVQYALWDLEEEIPNPSVVPAPSTEISAAVASLIEEAENAGWTDIHNVRVMNLYQYNPLYGYHYVLAQDMLVMVPVPATILLGLIGLGIGGWKLRKTI